MTVTSSGAVLPEIGSPATDGPDAPGLADRERTVESPGDLTPAERVELNDLRRVVYGMEKQQRMSAAYIHDLERENDELRATLGRHLTELRASRAALRVLDETVAHA